MAGRTIASMLKGSMLVIAAAALTACGGDGSSGQITVPNVVGDSQAAATAAITSSGLTLGAVIAQSSSTVAPGDVISEDPVAGTSVTSSTTVGLFVSSGPATASVPNVVDDTQAAASTAITAAGLTVGTVTMQSSASVASGHVISENPAAATSVTKGSAVALVVSSGPVTYTIGGTLIGLAPNAAVHVLNGADDVAISANGSFTLPTAVVGGGTYSVTVGTPTSAQACGVQGGSGTVASAKITNVVVYCTYNVSAATLHNTYTTVAADFGNTNAGTAQPLDVVAATIYDGVGTDNATATANLAGTIVTNVALPGTYTVTTTNAIPSLNGNGGIEGANGDAAVGLSTTSGTPPTAGIAVLPSANATTDSVNGNYTYVSMLAHLGTGAIEADEGPVALTNGSVTGTYTSNSAGTIVSGNPAGGSFTISNGLLTQGAGSAQGAVSADGDLIVLADTMTGDNPSISILLLQGTGVTSATFEGVYSVGQYGGGSLTATFGKAITLFAHGDGTFLETFTKNANGTITTDNTDGGTYTVAADGTLTLTDSEGNVYSGAISADGNALVLANVSSGETPAIWAGVRQ